MTQRQKMREVYRQFMGDERRSIEAYAEAEKRGLVQRKQNSRDTTPERYAQALLNDGMRKGWLKRPG